MSTEQKFLYAVFRHPGNGAWPDFLDSGTDVRELFDRITGDGEKHLARYGWTLYDEAGGRMWCKDHAGYVYWIIRAPIKDQGKKSYPHGM